MLLTKTTKKAGQYVNSKHVESLLTHYKKERWVQNTARRGQADSLSIWYSIEELQNFIQTARDNGADGIKMYFGVYNEETAREENLVGLQTLVLVASKTKELDNGGTIDKSVYINKNGKPEILAFNYGKPCPPSCGTGTGTGIDVDNPAVLIDRSGEGMIVI
jgi:hypothetical protein